MQPLYSMKAAQITYNTWLTIVTVRIYDSCNSVYFECQLAGNIRY